jgi:hypothetical protein
MRNELGAEGTGYMRQKGYKREKMMIPDVSRAAGLIVPEPSIMSGLIPFIELETGCDAEYIMAN